jgi:hypothetical protein
VTSAARTPAAGPPARSPHASPTKRQARPVRLTARRRADIRRIEFAPRGAEVAPSPPRAVAAAPHAAVTTTSAASTSDPGPFAVPARPKADSSSGEFAPQP